MFSEWCSMSRYLAAAPSAPPQSVHSTASGASTGVSATTVCALSARGRMKSAVAPERSRATSRGSCSSDKSRLAALPPRCATGEVLRGLRKEGFDHFRVAQGQSRVGEA